VDEWPITIERSWSVTPRASAVQDSRSIRRNAPTARRCGHTSGRWRGQTDRCGPGGSGSGEPALDSGQRPRMRMRQTGATAASAKLRRSAVISLSPWNRRLQVSVPHRSYVSRGRGEPAAHAHPTRYLLEEKHHAPRLERAGGLLHGGLTAGERARRLSHSYDPRPARFLRGEPQKLRSLRAFY
jgi:hypothetical protein